MLEAGSRIGAYVLVDRIGAGDTGEVWLARHTLLGRRAALKVLREELSPRSEVVAPFLNGARAMRELADPGIAQVYDLGEHLRPYVAMELLAGEPLDVRLGRERTRSVVDALELVRQVATALGAAHARGIVHRDLKPENIFLVPEVGGERVKLVDFGIILGTPAYMSPEQCRGTGTVDQRADIYALGCVLFELLTGAPPFAARRASDVIAMHMRVAAPTFASRGLVVPPELEALIARCLAKHAHQRYASGATLAAALSTVLASPALAPTQVAAVSPRRTKHPTTLSALAGERPTAPRRRTFAPVALIAVAVLTVFLASRSPEEAQVPTAPTAPPPPTTTTMAPPIAPPRVVAPFATELALRALSAIELEIEAPKPKPRPRPAKRRIDLGDI